MKEVTERIEGFRNEIFCTDCNEFTAHVNLDCCECELTRLDITRMSMAEVCEKKNDITLSTVERAVDRLFE